jgi:hypothetical protein
VTSRIRLLLPALALLPLVAGVLTAPAASADAPMGAERTVSFAGASVRVPADWPVIDVDGVPGCVRYDRHAVYLGEPSETDCPAHLVGRTTTAQILRGGSGGEASGIADSGDETVVLAASASGPRVVITTGGPDDRVASEIAAGVRIDGSSPRVLSSNRRAITDANAAAESSTATAQPDMASPANAVAPTTFTGYGFDTCSAPSLTQIDAWGSSPYRAVGVYVGGVNRGCDQPNLTPSWVTAVHSRGWHLIPTYVGLQAPCSKFIRRIDPATAAQQGAAAAADAVAQMSALGMGAGSPVYLDMESWDNTNAACSTATMTFTDAWTVGLHNAGYVSGFYSSAKTGVVALVDAVQHRAGFHAPDAVWFARWDGEVKTTDPVLPSTLWTTHQRIKQYLGPHDETYGGRRINIDSDYVNGPVTPAPVGMTTSALPSAVPGQQYSTTLVAHDGVPPYRFSLTSGSLPQGLSLSDSGVISGIATTMGTGSVTITVTDSSSTTGTATRSFPWVVTFTDVSTANRFFDDIAWLANTGVSTGYDDGTFRPGASVSRQAMAAFLYRYANPGLTPDPCTTAPFNDVATGNPFCPQISWLVNSGIAKGYDDGTFRPSASVSRQAMAAFLYQFANPGSTPEPCTTAPFPDVAAGTQFCPQITWLANNEIAGGYPDGGFHPGAPVSRQAMAAFLHRLDQLSS